LQEADSQDVTQLEARDDLARRLEDFDQEVLERALQDVQGLVEPHTWEAERLTAQEGLSGVETAECLQMPVASVFKARSRVLRMFRAVESGQA
jgi:RNA polymerase sigma-70 factor (ECF subfamily)